MLAVECKNISKTYGAGAIAVPALTDISITVEAGELLLLVGPSGSGKTTLISVIAGILTQDSGECLVYGQNMNGMKNDEKTAFRGQNIGFVFQSFNLIPMLTTVENAAVPLLLGGMPQKQAEEKAAALLTELGLQDKLFVTPKELSGGQQQRVAIARGCIHGPKLIVCDEPTSNLDHATGVRVMELLQTLAREQERAVIVVTHDARIFEFADRIIRLEDGKVREN